MGGTRTFHFALSILPVRGFALFVSFLLHTSIKRPHANTFRVSGKNASRARLMAIFERVVSNRFATLVVPAKMEIWRASPGKAIMSNPTDFLCLEKLVFPILIILLVIYTHARARAHRYTRMNLSNKFITTVDFNTVKF